MPTQRTVLRFGSAATQVAVPFVAMALVAGLVARAADPFGRVERVATVEPAPQVYVNPYASPAPTKLPGMRLAALGQVVRVQGLGDAYRATTQEELRAARHAASPAVAPQTLPTYQAARPLMPAASANAPATITHDRSVVPASYGVNVRIAPQDSAESGLNPLRRAESPVDRSTNPLR
jgi:hypothetical protein